MKETRTTTMAESEQQSLAILKQTVADACGVELNLMLDMNIKQYNYAQARWLWWYAVKFLTNYSYRVIARMTTIDTGGSVTLDTVGKGISKMSRLASSDFVWKKRWLKVKSVIDQLKKDTDIDGKPKQNITITIPFDIEVEIKRVK